MQLRQVALIDCLAFHAGLQLHHVGEERRLRAAEVVAAVTVGNMPVGVDQVGEVVQHLAAERGLAALHQAQHGEVGIPVIHLAEAPARHHVRVRQRQQAAVRRHVVLAAHQLGPQQIDVLAQRGVLTDRVGLHRRRLFEIGVHELAQVETGVIVLGQIVGIDQRRVAQREEVDKVFLVVEQLTALHRLEQFRVSLVGRWRRGRRRIHDRCVQRRSSQRARRNKHAQRQAKQRRAGRGAAELMTSPERATTWGMVNDRSGGRDRVRCRHADRLRTGTTGFSKRIRRVAGTRVDSGVSARIQAA